LNADAVLPFADGTLHQLDVFSAAVSVSTH